MSTTFGPVGRILDVDDLIDAQGVADLLGLSSRSAVSVYRSRYANFPAPAVERGGARLWHREDVLAWKAAVRRAG
ncbi:MAG: hypothetical protein JWM47_1535 [Acidimicrobiales bacterium]|nr:hypothetical protein [Acidimicrobiales bacterium]